MNVPELNEAIRGLESLMLKCKNPATVDHLEVALEDATGRDHEFLISTTGDHSRPWMLTGVVLNGRQVIGQRCWCHYRSFADLADDLKLLRKGKAQVSAQVSFCELSITRIGENYDQS